MQISEEKEEEGKALSLSAFIFFPLLLPPLSFSFPPFQRTNISIPFLTTHRDRDREIFIRGRVKLNFLHPREYIYIYVLIEIHLLDDGGRRIDCVRGGKEREREREEKKERRSLWPCNQHVRETRYTRSMYRLRDRAIKLAIHSISEQYLREMITRMGEHRWPILATAFVRRQTRLREMDR